MNSELKIKKNRKLQEREITWTRVESGQVLVGGFSRILVVDAEIVDEIDPKGGDVICSARTFTAKSGRKGVRISKGNSHILTYKENMERREFLMTELKRAIYQEFVFARQHYGTMIQIIGTGEKPVLKIDDIREG